MAVLELEHVIIIFNSLQYSEFYESVRDLKLIINENTNILLVSKIIYNLDFFFLFFNLKNRDLCDVISEEKI